MTAFHEVQRPLHAALQAAREIAGACCNLLTQADSLMQSRYTQNQLRQFRRAFPRLCKEVLAAFPGDPKLAKDLEDALGYIGEDAIHMIEWANHTWEELRAQRRERASDQEIRQRIHEERGPNIQAINDSCNLAEKEAKLACAAADKALSKRTAPPPVAVKAPAPPVVAKPPPAPVPVSLPPIPAQTRPPDSPKDVSKKVRKAGKRGPRNLSEFVKFKAAIEKGQRKNRLKKDVALEFTNGDVKKANALLKKLLRHPELPR